MTRVVLLVALLLVSGCHLMRPQPPGPIGEVPIAAVRSPSLRMAVQHSPPDVMAADTAVATITWTIPADDGRGPVDSMKVAVTRFTGGGADRLVPITSTTFEDRQPIPFGSASWPVTVQVCRYRRAVAPACATATGTLVVADVAPAPVGGLGVTVRKVPL